MRVLISTFGDGDEEKVLLAMRSLAYDQLVLVGGIDIEESRGFERIKNLEEMAGHTLSVETVGRDGGGFMQLVEEVSEVLSAHANETQGKGSIALNISGGSKLLGDASLFAAFRHGIESYHCEGKSVVRLPVLRGATAQDRFTEGQAQLIACLAEGSRRMDEAMAILKPASKQSLERVVRELRKAGVVHAELSEGKVVLSLTGPGQEVAKVLVRSVKGASSVS